MTMRPDFKQKLESFFEGCQRINAEHHAANFSRTENDAKWNMTWLKRYVRIENPSCYCFVEIETGEVLKSGGWKGPAITKTKRGNIFDEHNGLKHIGPYGVDYANEIKARVMNEIDEYVWDIALSKRLDPAFSAVAVGTREAVILNIIEAIDDADADRGMVPVGDVANIIINLWWHMRTKAPAGRRAQEVGQ